MKFKKEFMQRVAYNDLDPKEAEVVETVFIEKQRWSNLYSVVFKVDGKFYKSSYSVGATEMQNESPYEYYGDEIECDEVVPVEKTVITYVKKEG